MRRLLTALLSAVLMAVLWASPQGVLYRCAMDGEWRATCCCAPNGERAEPSDNEVERGDCCEIEPTADVSPATATTASEAGPELALVGLTRAPRSEPAFDATELVPLARGPPQAIGPPPYLRNCRFLI